MIGFDIKTKKDFFYYFDMYVITVIFYIDIILSFNTGLLTTLDQPTYKRKDIAIDYLKFDFWIDFISAFPFDAIWKDIPSIRVIKMLKVIKLFRFSKRMKLDKINFFSTLNMIINPMVQQIIKELFIMFFIAHYTACIWYGTSTYSRNIKDGIGNKWIEDYCVIQEDRNNITTGLKCIPLYKESLGTKYLTSIYFAFTLMGTVGYGDITPNHDNIAEMLVCCVLLIVGTTVMS